MSRTGTWAVGNTVTYYDTNGITVLGTGTIDSVDCVSWLINVPDIRILLLAGEKKLAASFFGGIKSYFKS